MITNGKPDNAIATLEAVLLKDPFRYRDANAAVLLYVMARCDQAFGGMEACFACKPFNALTSLFCCQQRTILPEMALLYVVLYAHGTHAA